MYPAYSRWIHSYRDLPLLLNQWNSVVRWEFQHPLPFIRSREFLWQEGHSAFCTREEAEKEVHQRLSTYQEVYENLLAVAVIPGHKTENEKFAGADFTSSVEAFIPTSGRAVQAATAHHLGQNFARIFDIKFLDADSCMKYAWQTSWGFTTRSLGIMVMTHGDDKGLVLPPAVSPIQVVIIPIFTKKDVETDDHVRKAVTNLEKVLEKIKLRFFVDGRENVTIGFKYNHWELKGVPVRISVGPRDVASNSITVYRRDVSTSTSMTSDDQTVATSISSLLSDIQKNMLERSKERLDSSLVSVTCWAEFLEVVSRGKLALALWCGRSECENDIKTGTFDQNECKSVKSLCVPFQYKTKELVRESCFACSFPSKQWTLFGKSY
eukprot:TRINITY_DN4619_c0_g1_i3.p1 TRINITY_DN4619_c0_g1~~TRINITY_DN4619_c0_g1_i3.p1  ORF type:complete len:380 (-),score=67.63 TRINITY_DN4619_c0_g1_i3:261-1400(-)